MRGVVSEAHTPAQCPTFGKVSAPQGAVTLNAVCSYWLQRAHYDAVILVKYTSRQTASLCHNFCVRPPSQPNCGIGVTGCAGFWERNFGAGYCQKKFAGQVTGGFSLVPIQRWLSLANSTLNSISSRVTPTQAPALHLLVIGKLVIGLCAPMNKWQSS